MASNRKALCVGINLYKNYANATLQGCVNDVKSMTSVLKTFLGFTDGDIVKLTDAQATKAQIMSNLTSMVADAKAGKLTYLVFSMSSHGTQVPDVSGDEPDRADEAFCPHDLAEKAGKWDPNFVITDDELHDLFVQLPKDVLLEVFLDTCHSGTGLRVLDLLPDRKPRFLPPPSVEAFKEIEGLRSRGLQQAMLEKGITHHILWAGCRDSQTSADAHIGNAWHGAFTYFFEKEINNCHNQLSRKDLLDKIRKDLVAGHYSQTPQLECEATVRGLNVMENKAKPVSPPAHP